MLNQPNNSLPWDPSAEEQPFLQEILSRNKKQPSYVLFLNQSLKDIERFCTNTLAPTSFRSILAVDTTYDIGGHYVTQTTYQNLSLFRKDTLKAPWFPGPVLIHRHQEEVDFSYIWQAVKRSNSKLEDLALIGVDECQELVQGIIAQTHGETGNLLGKEHVLKNIPRKLENLSFPKRQTRWIINDIAGNPFEKEKNGLIQCKTKDEFDECYGNLRVKWIDIEKKYTTRKGTDFIMYFEKHKLNKVKENMSKYATSKFKTKEHGQNPIEWLNFLVKDEINTDTESQSHKTASMKTCIKKLKDRSLRLYRDAMKAIYDNGLYTLSPSYSHLKVSYDDFKDLEMPEKENLLQRFLTYVPTLKVSMNSGYLFDEECDNEDIIVDSAKTFSVENTPAVNATELNLGSQLSESMNWVTSKKFHSNVAQTSKTASSVSTISSYNEKNTSIELLKRA